MAYNVAQAEVTVLPNAENFGEKLRAQIGSQADTIGRQIGEQMGDRIREKIRDGLNEGIDVPTTKTREQGERAGGSFSEAFKNRLRAALGNLPDVELDVNASAAQNRLAGVRKQLTELSGKRIGIDIDSTEALSRLELIRKRLGDLKNDADFRIRIDSRAASAELDRFTAELKAKAEVASAETGDGVAKKLEDGGRRGGGLMAAAIGGALMAGGPLIIGATGVVMAGVAGVILHNNKQVETALNQTGRIAKETFTDAAQGMVGPLTTALGTISTKMLDLKPQFTHLFDALGPAVQGVADGLGGLVENLLPGLTAAMQNGAPVFQGMASFMSQIGAGLGQMFQILSQNSQAIGDAFSAIGQVLAAVMPVLGELMVTGANLARSILPPLASALGLIADALHAIQPILPAIVLGFLALKGVSALKGPLEGLGTKLGNLAEKNLPGVSSAAGKAQGALGKIGGALPVIGIALGVLGALWEANEQQINEWKDAILEGGAAGREAAEQMSAVTKVADENTSGFKGFVNDLFGVGNGYRMLGHDAEEAKNRAADYIATLPPLQRENALATRAQNDLQDAMKRHDSDDAAAALERYRQHTNAARTEQAQLDAAVNGTSTAYELNKARLQELSNTAGAGQAQLNLLKNALDALQGKTVDTNVAEAQLTQQINSAIEAAKGMDGAMTDVNGVLDVHTQKGAAVYQSLVGMGDGINNVIAGMEKEGRSAQETQARDAQLRQSFIDSARQMGVSQQEAERLATEILGIPDKRNTDIAVNSAAAQAALDAVKQKIEALHDKAIKITTTYVQNGRSPGDAVNGLRQYEGMGGAIGGIVKKFADGGFNLTPMSGGIAQVVKPNTWRVIGDRVSDDEAFIPINGSARSLSILGQTAGRMGYGLVKGGGVAGGGTDARQYHFQISAPSDPRAIAREVRDAQRDLEFLHG